MKDTLIQAIRDRKHISFNYSERQREAQPATIGMSRKGKPSLRCFQTAGNHATHGHEWDFCNLSEIQNLKVLDVVFDIDPPGYNKGDKHMTVIYAEL